MINEGKLLIAWEKYQINPALFPIEVLSREE